eukprot:3460885-Rhodomonas_salina.2
MHCVRTAAQLLQCALSRCGGFLWADGRLFVRAWICTGFTCRTLDQNMTLDASVETSAGAPVAISQTFWSEAAGTGELRFDFVAQHSEHPRRCLGLTLRMLRRQTAGAGHVVHFAVRTPSQCEGARGQMAVQTVSSGAFTVAPLVPVEVRFARALPAQLYAGEQMAVHAELFDEFGNLAPATATVSLTDVDGNAVAYELCGAPHFAAGRCSPLQPASFAAGRAQFPIVSFKTAGTYQVGSAGLLHGLAASCSCLVVSALIFSRLVRAVLFRFRIFHVSPVRGVPVLTFISPRPAHPHHVVQAREHRVDCDHRHSRCARTFLRSHVSALALLARSRRPGADVLTCGALDQV